MYWRRSAYMWTLQAAALAGLAVMVSTTKDAAWQCIPPQDASPAQNCAAHQLKIVTAVAIWAFGTFTAFIWNYMLDGAKFWQDNWQSHVDHLEDYFSGALYKTYPGASPDAPYSVSQLNQLMAQFTLFLWVCIALAAIVIVFPEPLWPLIVLPSLAVPLFLAWYFHAQLRMKNYGTRFAKSRISKGSENDRDAKHIIQRKAVKYEK